MCVQKAPPATFGSFPDWLRVLSTCRPTLIRGSRDGINTTTGLTTDATRLVGGQILLQFERGISSGLFAAGFNHKHFVDMTGNGAYFHTCVIFSKLYSRNTSTPSAPVPCTTVFDPLLNASSMVCCRWLQIGSHLPKAYICFYHFSHRFSSG